MSRTLQLYQLQTLDSEIDAVEQRLVEIAALLGETEAMKQAKTTVAEAEQGLRQAQTAMQDLDLELKSLNAKIAGEEKKLYSGKISSAKEAANLQDEVTSLKRRRTDREDHLLEAMVAVEEAEQMVDQATTELSTIEADWTASQGILLAEQEALNQKLAELKNRRPMLTNAVSDNELAVYERLRPKKAGRAVAAVKSGVCQGCRIAISSSQVQRARSGLELAYCPACGRILYVP